MTGPIVVDHSESEGFVRARALALEGRRDDALESARDAALAAPDDVLTETLLIELRGSQDRAGYERAYERLTQVVEAHPGLRYPRLLKADIALRLGKLDEAVDSMEELLAEANNPGRLHLMLVPAVGRLRRYRDAWAHFAAAVRLGHALSFVDRVNGYVVGVRVGRAAEARRAVWPQTKGPLEQLRLRVRARQAWIVPASLLAGGLGVALHRVELLVPGVAGLALVGVLLLRLCDQVCRFLVSTTAILFPLLFALDNGRRPVGRAFGWCAAAFGLYWMARLAIVGRDRSSPVSKTWADET